MQLKLVHVSSRTMDNVALCKTFRVVSSKDTEDLTSNADSWRCGHGSPLKVNDDAQALNVLGHECNGDLEMEDDMSDLGRRCSSILESGFHVQQWTGLQVESRDVKLSNSGLFE